MSGRLVRLLGAAVLVLTAVPATLGVLLALLLLPSAAAVALVVAGTCLGTASHVVVDGWARATQRPGRWGGWAGRLQGARSWHSGAYGALLVLVLAGFVAALGPGAGTRATVLLAAVAVGTGLVAFAPAGVAPRAGPDRVERPSVASPGLETDYPAIAPWDQQAFAAGLRVWSDDAVCRAWRCSYVRLQRTGGPGLERIAGERRAYLDELERRHPAGFQSWIASGARAPSDPSRYLTTPPPTVRPAPPSDQPWETA